jgi:hypothetical protein
VVPRSDGLEIYEVGEPVPATTFVGATLTVEPLADGWSRVYFDAEDGSRWARSLRRGDVDCAVATAADGVFRCLPRSAGSFTRGLLAADCMTPVADGDRSSCSLADLYLWDSGPGCPDGRTVVRRASARLDAGQVRVQGTCWPDRDPYREAYSAGEELPPGNFPEVNRGILDGPGRLRRQARSTSGGTYGVASLWDSKLGFGCFAAPARDGSQRCLPGSVVTAFFSDPECTRPITGESPCAFSTVLTRVPGACPARYRVFRVGAVTAVDRAFWFDAAGRCIPTPTPPLPSEVIHSLEEIQPTDLAELSLTQ